MTHTNEEVLNEWIDGELSPKESDRVEAHLQECPPCREKASQLGLLCKALDALPACPVSEKKFTRQIMAAWKNESKDMGLFRLSEWRKGWNLLTYAAVATGLFIGLILGSQARFIIAPQAGYSGGYAINYLADTNGETDPYLQLLVSDDGGDL